MRRSRSAKRQLERRLSSSGSKEEVETVLRRQLIVRESGIELSCSLNLAKQRARGSCTAPQEVCLSGSFVADIGRSDVQGILAGRILWEHPSGHSLFEQPQDRSAVLDNDP